MKKKKTFLYTSAIIATLLMTACSSNGNTTNAKSNHKDKAASVEVNKEGFPIVNEAITLSLIAPGTGIAEWKDMPTLQEYAKMTNVDFKFQTPPLSDFQTKLNLAFASGDIPGIIFGAGTKNLTPAMEVDYGTQGVLLPLEDLIADYAPNIQKMLDENPDVKKSITALDGHIYSLPRVNKSDTSSWYTGPMWYNGKWLEALGVKELPKTVNEFYDLLVRFKTEDPNGNGKADEIPLLDVKMNSTRIWLLGAFGLKEWGIEEVDGEVRYTPTTENYKGYLTFMHKLYEEKLLDPETFSQADEQKKAKGENNQIGVFPDWFSFFTTGETEDEAVNNPMWQPLTSEFSDEAVISRNPGMTRGAFSITNTNPNPEASIRWVDYFYTAEGYTLLNQGKPGLLWDWKDEEGGKKVRLTPPDGMDSEEYRATLTPDYGITAPALSVKIDGYEDTDFEKFISSETEEKIIPYAEVPFPLVYLTAEEQQEINTIEVDVSTYVEQMEARFITGVEPLDKWDDYVKTIEKMNIDRYVEIHQAAYDRWTEAE